MKRLLFVAALVLGVLACAGAQTVVYKSQATLAWDAPASTTDGHPFLPGDALTYEVYNNLVTNAGLQHILDVVFSSGSAVATWYVGLISDSPTIAAADTMSSHAGWTEFAAYDEATRQEYVETRSNQTESNAASPAAFTISTNSSVIAGAFLASNSTKSGSTGTLLCAVAFTGGDKSADDGDTLSVTYTFTGADDGA